MQAVILAAGFGSRLGAVTQGKPKSFLEINNEALIDRAIRLLNERGITDIHVVTGFKSDLMYEKLNGLVTLHINPLYFCTNVLASFSVAMPALSDSFIFLHADTIFEDAILDSLIAADGDIVLPVDFKNVQEEEMKVCVDKNGKILQISKEIELSSADGEFMGLAKISQSVLSKLNVAVLDELKQKKHLQAYFESAIQNLINNGLNVSSIDISNKKWIEIDFEDDYEQAVTIFSKA